MIRTDSRLTRLSPLASARPPVRATASSPQEPKDEVARTPKSTMERAEKPVRSKSHKLAKIGLGTALGVSALAGIMYSGPIREVLMQYGPGSGAPGLSLTEQLRYQGYAGEAAEQRQQVTQTLLDNLDLFDSPSGHQDAKIGISDLQRVAADSDVAPAVRDSAQAVLADPVLLNSLDVARGDRVDHVISQGDLEQALDWEQSGYFGSFVDVERELKNDKVDDVSAFDYFDQLGKTDQKFSWDDLNLALSSDQTPDPFRDLARDLTLNPTYMNAFDVASARNSPTVVDLLFNHSQQRDGVVSAQDLDNIALAPIPEVGRQFTETDQAALNRVLQDGKLGGDIFQDFYQTDRGNCASTAVIKMAMDRYGAHIFQDVQKLDNGNYRITMRDGFQEEISPGELEAAATAAHYHGQDPGTKGMATLSYAAMAKRAWMMGHEGAQTYGHALLSLNNGEITPQVPTYLGLKGHVHEISPSQVSHTQGAVVHGNGHAYFVDNVDGTMYGDKWGTRTVWEGKTFVNDGELQKNAFIID